MRNELLDDFGFGAELLKNSDEIPQAVIDALIEVGRSSRGQSTDVATRLNDVQDYDWINRLHWKTWNSVTATMDNDDIDALVRGLALADSLPGWTGGSVAAVIWVFRELQRRRYSDLTTLAQWVIEHDTNPYAPFGSMRGRANKIQE